LGALYAAPLQPQFWNAFLGELSAMSGVTKAALIAHDVPANDHRIIASLGDSVTESIPLYERQYCKFDEWTLRFPKRGMSGRVILGEEVWPEASLLKSTFYNDFLKYFDVCQMACFATAGGQGAFDAFSVYRGPHEDSFSAELLGLLQMLMPHLETALSMRRRLVGLESRVSDLENAFDRLTSAILLLDEQQRCILVNQAARRILDQRSGLYLDRSILCAQGIAESAKLREAVSCAISAGSGRGNRTTGAIPISRPGRKPLQILAAPFRSEIAAAPGRAAAIVFINDPEEKSTLPAETLRALFGLTTAEVRLAIELLDGKSLAEAADFHRIGRETVRTQVKSI
jgi:DNA-binding CsgD family transcriptional regulator